MLSVLTKLGKIINMITTIFDIYNSHSFYNENCNENTQFKDNNKIKIKQTNQNTV